MNMNMKIAVIHIVISYIVGILGAITKEFAKYDKGNPYYFDFGSKTTICPQDAKCLDGKFNFLCAKEPMKRSPNCKRFVPMRLTAKSRSRMVSVHNGLRNKLAYDKRLSNMNLVYWNNNLQRMAEQYLRLCRPYQDTCLKIGLDGHVVGQNTLFVRQHYRAVIKHWEGRTVRHWFLELRSHYTVHDLIEQHLKGEMNNLTQLIWPSLEFVGCGAATMFDGFFIVCYYYPPMDQSFKSQLTFLRANEQCVCPKSRLMCSLLFTSLCGIDLLLDRALTFNFGTLKLLIFFMSFILLYFL